MLVLIRIGDSRTIHIAEYNVKRGTFKLCCNTLRYPTQRIDIASGDVPTEKNVTCIECIHNKLR